MSALRAFAFLSVAFLSVSGAALAQNTADDPNNPHSTTNKDSPTQGRASKAEVESGEIGNPNSVRNKDRTRPTAQPDMYRAERGNPERLPDKERDEMNGMVGMSDKITTAAVLERLEVTDKAEVEMGKLAQQNGTARAQEYGRMVDQDHAAASIQVEELAQRKGVTLSNPPKDRMAQNAMKALHEIHGGLAKLHGQDFDKAFAKAMFDDHRNDMDHLDSWRDAVGDKDVRALIDQMLPVLQRHLSAAKQLGQPAAHVRTA